MSVIEAFCRDKNGTISMVRYAKYCLYDKRIKFLRSSPLDSCVFHLPILIMCITSMRAAVRDERAPATRPQCARAGESGADATRKDHCTPFSQSAPACRSRPTVQSRQEPCEWSQRHQNREPSWFPSRRGRYRPHPSQTRTSPIKASGSSLHRFAHLLV